jgi:hypothetical protein
MTLNRMCWLTVVFICSGLRRLIVTSLPPLQVVAWFSRLDCLVIGPGLGRDSLLLDTARRWVGGWVGSMPPADSTQPLQLARGISCLSL